TYYCALYLGGGISVF
nr:immunoglobulin light chain junction region [Macaca mulatta]